jgi:protein-S-isoprenylcysteine O-methyltransferase Ste14
MNIDSFTLYDWLLWFQIAISPIILISLIFVTAPYGRHSRGGWGLTLDSRLAWILMELPAVLTIAIVYLCYAEKIHPLSVIFLLIWEFHYVYRTFIFPLQLRRTQKNFPVLIILFALLFNVINGFINGSYLFDMEPIESSDFFLRPHFMIGSIIFLIGFIMHFHSDRTILRLRKDPSVEYAVPRGGMFSYVTNPNYLGEFIQWSGWAILTWSPAGAAFAIFTLANLLPRAISNHEWYKNKFPDYPPERKRFFPFIY